MDEAKGKSVEIEEWMKELLPADGAADIGIWQHSQRTSAEMPNTYQLSMDSNTYPRNLSQHQLVQTSPGCNSTSPMVKQQDSFNVLQHAGQATFQKILEAQSCMVNERAHPRLHMSAFHRSQNLTLADQLKPGNQMQAMLLGPLQDSTPQVDLTTSIDWVNQAYHKIQQMKEIYLSDILILRSRAHEIRRRATNAEQVNKSDKTRSYIERIVKFLNMPKSDLLQWRKEKLYQTMNEVMKQLCRIRAGNSLHVKQTQQVEASVNHFEAPQIQQRENYLQPASLHQSLRPGGALSLPQSSLNSFKLGSSAGVDKADALSMANASQYNPMRSTQQWTPPGSMVPSSHNGSQTVFDQRALRMLLHPLSGVPQHNNLAASHQAVNSSRNVFSSLDYSTSPTPQTTPVSMSPPQSNQQDPAMKRQKMKQPVQQFMAEKNKQQLLQKRSEDIKLRRFVGFNQRWSPVLPPSSSPYAISPQNSQQSSSQLELKDLSSKFSKSATPSLSASPSALPSPLTPLTPSSNPPDSLKSQLIEESSKLAKTSATTAQPPLQDKNQNQVATDTRRLTKSCFHSESTCSGDKQSSHDKEDPVRRLVEVVKSISSRALHATLRDIDAVTNSTDRIAGHFLHGDPTNLIFQDLADDNGNCDNGASSLDYGTCSKSRMRRELDTLALNDSATEVESLRGCRIKRLKIEPNNLLLQEIKEINKKLIEVVVDVMNVEDVSTGSDEGTRIRCSYIPVGLSRNIKTPDILKLMFPNLLLELIVPADYPNSSPTVLETMPSGFSESEDGRYLWTKAKSNFSLSLRKLSQFISVKEMAETWNVCAREVFHEFAEQMGGGSFSSTYGKWENCAVAG